MTHRMDLATGTHTAYPAFGVRGLKSINWQPEV
jgi:hypothetical protein